jgi:hypothetical protein
MHTYYYLNAIGLRWAIFVVLTGCVLTWHKYTESTCFFSQHHCVILAHDTRYAYTTFVFIVNITRCLLPFWLYHALLEYMNTSVACHRCRCLSFGNDYTRLQYEITIFESTWYINPDSHSDNYDMLKSMAGCSRPYDCTGKTPPKTFRLRSSIALPAAVVY